MVDGTAALERFKAELEDGGDRRVAQFLNFLLQCERKILAVKAYEDGLVAAVPEEGDLDFGFGLYWLQNIPSDLEEEIANSPKAAFILETLRELAPDTQITEEVRADFVGWVGKDGTIYGFGKYEQLDPRWAVALINYTENIVSGDVVKPFPCASLSVEGLSAKGGGDGDPVLGIIGDWGTGYYDIEGQPCPAETVMGEITKQPIDYLMHLGDVYYAGTDERIPAHEEQRNFMDLWVDQGEGRNFTLNSNHEMYGRAQGYFGVALQKDGPFAHQNGQSFFARKYHEWLILGLDSAYYSDAQNGLHMYMKGAIGTALAKDSGQISAISAVAEDHKGPIMVMTHHNACDTETALTNILYAQVCDALGRPPTIWYWGHVHNGIVYKQLHSPHPDRASPTKGRCCGHGAIGFGNASGLEGQGNIPYYAHTPSEPYPRVKNGYALVTLRKDGGFHEAFYEIGVEHPPYQREWAADELE